MTRVAAPIRAYRARIERVLDRCLALPESGTQGAAAAPSQRRGPSAPARQVDRAGCPRAGRLPTPAPRSSLARGQARLSCVTVPSRTSPRRRARAQVLADLVRYAVTRST